jgi:tRNA(fMet)-specific endonuclease VapC
MSFLLDTDTCVYWLRGHEAVRRHLTAATPEAVLISAITLAELYYGAACSAQPEANHRAVNDFVAGMPVLTMDFQIARAFGDLKAQLRRQGMLLEDFDLVVAATALTHNLTLVTNNEAHFGRIPHLSLANWV